MRLHPFGHLTKTAFDLRVKEARTLSKLVSKINGLVKISLKTASYGCQEGFQRQNRTIFSQNLQ